MKTNFRRQIRWAVWLLGLGLLATFFAPSGHAAAATSYTGVVVNHSEITVNGATYFDSQIDTNLKYIVQNQSDTCPAKSYIAGFQGGDGRNMTNVTQTATLHLFATSTTQGDNSCVETRHTIRFTNTNNFNIYFEWADSGTIVTTDHKTMIFTQNDNQAGAYYDSGGTNTNSTCQSHVSANAAAPGLNGSFVIARKKGGSNPFDGTGWPNVIRNAKFTTHSAGCDFADGIHVAIADPADENGNLASTLEAGTSDDANATTGDDAAPSIDCDTSVSLATMASLRWLICPFVDGMLQATKTVDNLITSYLSVGTTGQKDDPNQIFCDKDSADINNTTDGKGASCQAYHIAWSSFRDIALGLLVIIGLIIIISEMLGG